MPTTPSVLPSPPSPLEADLYYAGLPSVPRLVARSSITPWEKPEAYPTTKELRVVGEHALSSIWEDDLALKVQSFLEFMDVEWTSIDVVRIGNIEKSSAPVILWIGVMPGSLPGEEGVDVACKCRDLLWEFEIRDVEVEIRESIVTRSAGPSLLTPSPFLTLDLCEPLATNLGLSICAQSTPGRNGTGGFFVFEGGKTERLLLVTARHVLFKPDAGNNNLYRYTNISEQKCNVLLFGDTALDVYLQSIKARQDNYDSSTELLQRRLELLKEKGDDQPLINAKCRELEAGLEVVKEEKNELDILYHQVSTQWLTQESRILGHVILSPPIGVGVGVDGYTEDWAVIEIDASKIDGTNFIGNVIDLASGTGYPPAEFNLVMHPNVQNPPSFKFPADGLLKLQDIISAKEMRSPKAWDENNDPCIMVLKRGHTTGLTIGRANNIISYTRYIFPNGPNLKSKEWAIIPCDYKSKPFSDKGDSGSVVVDGRGRIGGLLTGGSTVSPTTESFDISYATPIEFLLKQMEARGLCIITLSINILS